MSTVWPNADLIRVESLSGGDGGRDGDHRKPKAQPTESLRHRAPFLSRKAQSLGERAQPHRGGELSHVGGARGCAMMTAKGASDGRFLST